jgi:hypothetical protein
VGLAADVVVGPRGVRPPHCRTRRRGGRLKFWPPPPRPQHRGEHFGGPPITCHYCANVSPEGSRAYFDKRTQYPVPGLGIVGVVGGAQAAAGRGGY